jgi:IclR family transcriptional regulator, KDG regulon repressor
VRKQRAEYTVESVDRALQILDSIADQGGPIGVTAISNKVGLHPTTVFRLLDTLVRRGHLQRSPSNGHVALGLKCVELGACFLKGLELRHVALPFLRGLDKRTGEAVHLTICDGEAAVYIEKLESPKTLSVQSRVGYCVPLYCTAVGKIFLAFMEGEFRRNALAHMKLLRCTANTHRSKPSLLADLKQIRRLGYALDRGEYEDGVHCLAAPIWNHNNQLLAAVSLTLPAVRD